MSSNDIIHGIYTERVAVGLSGAVGVTAGAYARGFILNMYAAGGTLEIHGVSAVFSSLIGTGYRLAPSTQLVIPGPASFYLTSVGATSVVDIIKTRTLDPVAG